VTAGPDGGLWFIEGGLNQIGRMTTSGAFTEYALPESGTGPNGITAGPDGALWFTEFNRGEKADAGIGRITASGIITQYGTPSGQNGFGITGGPDGAVWFTTGEFGGSTVARITPAGALTEYTNAGAYGGITTGPDGALWFTEEFSLGRITTSGTLAEYALPMSDTTPTDVTGGITTGPDGALWFTEPDANLIGRAAVSSAPPSISSGGIGPVYSSVNIVQPGEWASIYGAGLASSTVTWNGTFSTSLGGHKRNNQRESGVSLVCQLHPN
jgi:streptogramin lyase